MNAKKIASVMMLAGLCTCDAHPVAAQVAPKTVAPTVVVTATAMRADRAPVLDGSDAEEI